MKKKQREGKTAASVPEENVTPKKKNRGGKRAGSGRKKFIPTDEERRLVREAAGCGLTHEQIGRLVRGGINRILLARRFPEELENGKSETIFKVAKCLVHAALDGDKASQMFYLKTQGHWHEKSVHELTGAEGAPIQFGKIELVIVDPKERGK